MMFSSNISIIVTTNKSTLFYEELSKCSKCGFCQAFCPVYAVTGRETEVARGRNAQLLGVYKGDLKISEIEPSLSTCILCKACVPSCFSGVKTDEAVRAGREALAKERGGVLKKLIFKSILPYPTRVSALLNIYFSFKRLGVVSLAIKTGIVPEYIKKADSLLADAPKRRKGFKPSGKRIANKKADRVAYFRSCGFGYLLTDSGEATIKVIEDLGYEVVFPENNCCGLPPYAHGYTEAAKNLARKNIRALEGFETILTECGSCSSFLKKYAEVLSDDPEYAERAKRLSERVVDSNEFIYKSLQKGQPHGAAPTPYSLKVTYHDPCHLSRYQGITKEPREIIKSIPGIEFVELPEADWCCGGAGSYSIENREISEKILDRKINNVKKTGADLLVTSCPACMIQLSYGIKRAGLNVRVMHVNQLFTLSLKP